MAKARTVSRLPGATYALSDTGPLISAFQSESFPLLTQLFPEVHIAPACLAELIQHGWETEVRSASSALRIVKLTSSEQRRARAVARQIAHHPATNDGIVEHHLGEAQVLVLALRARYRNDVLLLDELAARAVAKEMRVKLSGFPGVLLLAVQGGLLSAEELKERLERCRTQGTHYGVTFIKQVYDMAKRLRRTQ
jgi:predicted nucleic acid-binding protein